MSSHIVATVASAGGGRVALGVAVAAAAAACYDLGYVLEKQALTNLPSLGMRPGSVIRTVLGSSRWVAGFVAMLAGLALQVVALTLAPVAVVQPVLAGGVLALVLAGRMVLGERLGRRESVAAGLVVAAVLSIAISSQPGGGVASSAPAGRYLALALPCAAVAVAAVWLCRAGASGSRASHGRRAAAMVVSAGLLYGLGAIAEKAVATHLVGRGMVAGSVAALGTPYPWVFVAVTLAGMIVFQVALQRHPATLVAPLVNLVSSGLALIGASVVFGEALLPAGWWSLPRAAGFLGIAAAIGVLCADRVAATEPALA